MKCKRVQQQLLDYSEELLDQKTRSLIEEHLRICPECVQELRGIEHTIHLLQSMPLQEPPEVFWTDFPSQVMRKIRRMDTPPVTRRFLFFPNFRMAAVAVAIVILVIGSILFYYSGAFQQVWHPTELTARRSEQQENGLMTPLHSKNSVGIETMLSKITSEALINDILNAEFALIDGDTAATFDVDNSDEMLYFLIDSLTDEEKDLLLSELYKMK